MLESPKLSEKMVRNIIFYFQPERMTHDSTVVRHLLRKTIELCNPDVSDNTLTTYLRVLNRVTQHQVALTPGSHFREQDWRALYEQTCNSFDTDLFTDETYHNYYMYIHLVILLAWHTPDDVCAQIVKDVRSETRLSAKSIKFLATHAEKTGTWWNLPSMLRVELFYNPDSHLDGLRTWLGEQTSIWENDVVAFLEENGYPVEGLPFEWLESFAQSHATETQKTVFSEKQGMVV